MRLSTLCAGSDTGTSIIAKSDDRMFRTVLLQLLEWLSGTDNVPGGTDSARS